MTLNLPNLKLEPTYEDFVDRAFEVPFSGWWSLHIIMVVTVNRLDKCSVIGC